MRYHEVVIPQVSVNDQIVTLESFRFKNLDYVNQGDLIFSISSAKSVEDISTNYSGYILYLVEEGDEIEIGQVGAEIWEKMDEASDRLNSFAPQEVKSETNTIASKKAIRYAKEINFDLKLIRKKGIIKVKDIEDFLNMT
jgi:pyruvate/2-oxoglutarate dehydrogenase complex dihydrolipoamide acyltransferase (E2) component